MRRTLLGQLLFFVAILIIPYFIHSYTSYTLPKRIWTYWDRNVPKYVKNNIENNKKVLYDWEYISITETTLNQYLNPETFPDQFVTLSSQHKADYIRLELLKQYGGVWLDGGIVVHSRDAFNKLYREAVAAKSQLSAFTLTEKEELYIENWFIMVPLKSPVIELWSIEYTIAVKQGFLQYKNSLFQEGDIHIIEKIYKKNGNNVYLTQHACLQAVLQKRLKHPVQLLLYKSEDTMFKLHFQCDWKADCIKYRMKNDPSIKKIPFIKLRGPDR
jgi:hypothetical protein